MYSSVYRGRGALLAALAVLLPLASATGCAAPGVTKAQVLVTRDQRVVVQAPPLHKGEAILHVENDDGAAHVVVLARLDPGVEALPLTRGSVPAGHPSQQSFTGVGYHVVAKSERLPAYFNGPNRVRTTFHLYLRPGRYVVFANSPGDYARGEYATVTVSA